MRFNFMLIAISGLLVGSLCAQGGHSGPGQSGPGQPGLGNFWTLPVSIPRTSPDEGEIYGAALLPVGPDKGHVILWRDWLGNPYLPTYVIDPNNLPTSIGGTKVVVVQNSEFGCSALSFDRNGRLLVAAGHSPNCGPPGDEGTNAFSIYDPSASTWIESKATMPVISDSNSCRHYPTGFFLPNDLPPNGAGDIFAIFGGGAFGADIPMGINNHEGYFFETDTWFQAGLATVPFDIAQHCYTYVTLTPGGLYMANPGLPGTGPIPTWYLDSNSIWVAGPDRSSIRRHFCGYATQTYPTAVPGVRTQRLTLMGGRASSGLTVNCDSFEATNTIEWIDDPISTNPAVAWSPLQSVLKRKRLFHQVIALPNGELALIGGASHDYIAGKDQCSLGCTPTDVSAVQRVEIYNPQTNTSKLLKSEPTPRLYHSVAVLLPDGRIFSAGGDTTSSTPSNSGCHAGQDVTIYSPPYLALDRPTSVSVSPSSVLRGGTINISATLPPATAIAKITLTAPGVSTHQLESKERYMELEMLAPDVGFQAKAQIPFPIWEMPPAYYLVWIVLDTGAVSEAEFIKIGM